MTVFNQQVLLPKLANRHQLLVFGSNLGWQALFVSVLYDVRVKGFEVVQYRYDASVKYAQGHDIDNVQFELQDATKALLDWSTVGEFG